MAAFTALLALFCAPLSKPGTSAALAMLALMVPFLTNSFARIREQLRSPLVLGGLILFAVFALSAAHAHAATRWTELWAYRTFFVFGFIGIALPTSALRTRGWHAFVAGSGVLLVASIVYGAGLVPRASSTTVGQFAFAKDYGQQALIYVIAGAASIAMGMAEPRRNVRTIWFVLATGFSIAIPLLLESRAAWVVLCLVYSVLAIQLFGAKRGGHYVFALTMALALLSWFSPLQQSRLNATKNDIAAVLAGETRDSWGVRAELLRTAPLVISRAPVLGHGIGSWNIAMRSVSPEKINPLLVHIVSPHQELLFIAAEQGVLGATIYVALCALLLRRILKISDPSRRLYVLLFTAYVTYASFNSVLADFTHRHVLLLLLALMPVNGEQNATNPTQ